MVYINARCKEILTMLLKGKDYTSLKQIALEMGVSKRSIYYDICKLNEWLVFYHVPELEIVRGKGILISEENVKKIQAIVEQRNQEEKYILSPTERIQVIYCYILISHLSEHVYIEQLSAYCNVSRNTIFNDLRVLVNQIKDYNLTLEYATKTGYKIGGDVVSIRAMFFMYFNELLPLIDSGILDFIYKEPVREYLAKLETIVAELKTEYVDGILLSLAALVPLMYRGRRRPYFSNMKMENVVNTKEYQKVKETFPDLAEEEWIYLCVHLLGSRVSVKRVEMFENFADQSVYEITKSLVAEFEKRACVFFDEKDELERALFLHINTSLYRYRYGVQIGNQMAEDVKREYGNLFEITKKVSKYLEQLVGLPIHDNEVAYLALHFGAHLKAAKEQQGQIRILIVCVNGVSTGSMIKREVQELLPEAKIVGVVSAIDVIQIKEICDLVITTAKIESMVPTIQVHPILTDYDRSLILKYRQSEQKQEQSKSEDLFELIKKYVAPENQENLKNEIDLFFRREGTRHTFAKQQPGLLDILKNDRVQVLKGTYKWQEAIHLAGEKLVQERRIEERYLDQIVSQLLYYGPFMFLNQGLLLAHAKPEDGVRHMDISMTVFKEPVYFSDVYHAKIILTLAAKDQEKHLHILKDIMTIFEDERQTEEIAALETKEEVLVYMEALLRQREAEEQIR